MLATILLSFILISSFACLPIWPYSRNWGYLPSGGMLILLIILVLLLLTDRI